MGFLVGATAMLAFLSIPLSLHTVQEGYVGVYFRGGALLSEVTGPGFNWQLPFVTSCYHVQVTVQTDHVDNIPCGTSGGVLISFDKVEVVNRLRSESVYDTIKNYTVHYDKTWIFDKIHHEINQFCSKHTLQEVYIDLFDTLDENLAKALQRDCNEWAPGIEIIAVRVTKPNIPDSIRTNYANMEIQKTKLLIAHEAQRVVEKEAETDKKRATIEAEKVSAVSKINMIKEIAEKESIQKIHAIEDIMHVDREKAWADAAYYRAMREAEANAGRLTEAFLEYTRILSLTNNTKIYFGEKIPTIFTANKD
ncbi:hypothetical protein, variant 1 [Aphanomyces invadans]|uniref:Band 7 domain-containing protein n=1 Tax=Aphanomyces invadans TaxID=157072 RepID=A0A024U3U3_9STRA|nr:hypothetical protein, variant 1 [Aphanomyces invadans]ETW00293.1 hypothetical protein, variant 1 [Aphanomyces invadans]|eukprot:XP_008871318.1 hypothetical protein, variant 1 [Aphanomyces invadans]